MSKLNRFSKNQQKKSMRYKPENVLNTSKVREIKTSLLLLQSRAKVSLIKRNVPAVTQTKTNKKIALTKRRFAVSAKSRAILRSLAARKNRNKKTTLKI